MKKKIKIISVSIIALLLVTALIINPSEKKHHIKIKQGVSAMANAFNVISKKKMSSNDATNGFEAMLMHDLEYKNYFICSKIVQNSNSTITFGVLGMVFNINRLQRGNQKK